LAKEEQITPETVHALNTFKVNPKAYGLDDGATWGVHTKDGEVRLLVSLYKELLLD
jgi:hypothetical protein